jgi:Cys-tRNA(Pro)/Cys-tRNA(Cys) deacylase
MASRAISYLKRKGIACEVVRYEHIEKGAAFASSATGFPLHRTIKTLVVDLGQKNCVLALIPGDRQLDLKKLAKVFSVKRAAMVDIPTAQRLTGYLVGGVSPFETTQAMPAVISDVLLDYETVMVNAGKRGLMLKMMPTDIVTVLECRVAAIDR